jgi:hypothetical protein
VWREVTWSAVSGKSLARDPAWSFERRPRAWACQDEQHLLPVAVPQVRLGAAQCGPAACGHGLPMALLGSAIPDPQSKAAAPPEGGRLAGHTARRRPARAVAQGSTLLPPLLAVGSLFCSLRGQPVGGMKMCTLLIGSNQAVAAPPGAMILRTPSSTMVTP